ncbi:unnamed protein product [Brachionus calyciflorus]|uniref:Uncharacterized protein n=1 Tax=Brachionus calyciflorus TaxID=104777 RepID=A0A813UFV7_9BILA|nr:unnamed protein product [Brachionus calyciflorus]
MAKQKVTLAKLSQSEKYLYFLYLFGLIFYAFIVLVQESSYFKNKTKLINNSNQLNFERERLDVEWNNFIERMFKELNIIYLILIPILKNIFDQYLPKLRY